MAIEIVIEVVGAVRMWLKLESRCSGAAVSGQVARFGSIAQRNFQHARIFQQTPRV